MKKESHYIESPDGYTPFKIGKYYAIVLRRV